MGQNDLQIRVNAKISNLKLAEDCELSDTVTKAVLKRMREEDLSFKEAMESFFGLVQHRQNGAVEKIEKPQKTIKPSSARKIKPWTQDEEELLILNAYKGYEECSKLFPDRTYKSVGAKGRDLGISLGISRKNKYWSEEEVCILIDYCDRLMIKQLATILGRSEQSVHCKLYNLRH